MSQSFIQATLTLFLFTATLLMWLQAAQALAHRNFMASGKYAFVALCMSVIVALFALSVEVLAKGGM